jgi:ABC-type sugar transport system ATPase subunit
MTDHLQHFGPSDHVPVDAPVAGVIPKETLLFEALAITKRYGSFAALDNMNFYIGKSEVVGLLGDNGAGKSTLVKMISGINPPTSGEIFVNGEPTTLNSRAESEASRRSTRTSPS